MELLTDGAERRLPAHGLSVRLTYSDRVSFSRFVGDSVLVGLEYRTNPRRELLLQLEPPGPYQRLSVCFSPLQAWAFEEAGSPSVLFDIALVDLEAVLASRPKWSQRALRSGWPMEIGATDSLLNALQREHLQAFEVQATTGLHGIVFAGGVRITDARGQELVRWPGEGKPPHSGAVEDTAQSASAEIL